MYCNNCGKTIPDNAKFCNYCGAKTASSEYRHSYVSRPETASQPAPKPTAPRQTPPQQTQAAPAEKKGGFFSRALICLLVFCVCYAIGNKIASPKSTPVESPDSGLITITATESPTVSAPAIDSNGFASTSGLSFEDILPAEAAQLPNRQHFYSDDYAAYVLQMEDGSISLLEFGYKGDLIQEMENTLIVPVTGQDSAAINEFITTAEDLIQEMRQQKNSVSGRASTLGNNAYVFVEVRVTNMNLSDVIDFAAQEELITVEPGTTALSMNMTESELKLQGFARK